MTCLLPSLKVRTISNLRKKQREGDNTFTTRSFPRLSNCRVNVLAKLQHVTIEFVKHVGRLKGLPPSVIDNAGGKVFTFGSYRLGVYGPGMSTSYPWEMLGI